MVANSAILVILTVIAAYALLSKRVENSFLTLPIIFTALGLAIGQFGLALLPMDIGNAFIHRIAEITLIVVLFADASSVKLKALRQNASIPVRMLLIGMPLTLVLGTLVAYWVSPDQPWVFALLVAAILTPTDAALGQSVLTNMHVPERISQSINVESGLNDGLALPIVLIAAIATASMTGAPVGQGPENVSLFAAKQVILGPIIGIITGFLAAKLLDVAVRRDTATRVAQGLYFLSIAFLAYFISETIGGNGFIAAFIAGLTFGNILKAPSEFIREFVEGDGQLLTLFAFLIFGAVLAPIGLEHFSLKTIALAISFLTFVRMVPIWISLVGTGLTAFEKFFVGWFGPRGLASILFALLVLERYDIPKADELTACVVLTVLLSILVHGLSASLLANRFTPKNA